MTDLDKLKDALALVLPVGSAPLSREWVYSSIRHCQRNMDLEEYCTDIEAGTHRTPDRQVGGEMADILNAAPAIIAELEAARAKIERLWEALERIDAMCPATCDMSVAHMMAEEARAALVQP